MLKNQDSTILYYLEKLVFFLFRMLCMVSALFETDSSTLVSAMRSIVPHMSILGHVYDDITSLLVELHGSSGL